MPRHARIATITAGAVALTAGGAALANADLRPYLTSPPVELTRTDYRPAGAIRSEQTMVSACTIRFNGRGYRPTVHANSAHLCTNVESVSINANGDLYIDFHRGSAVLTVQVDEDETLTSRGIFAGGSSGTNEVNVRFYDSRLRRTLNLTRFADRKRIGGNASNIWLFVVQAAPPLTPSMTPSTTPSTQRP